MLDHPQDALRLAREHQHNLRKSVALDRKIRSKSKNLQQPLISQEWKRTLFKLRNFRIEITLVFQK